MEMVIGLDFGSLSCRGILVKKTGEVVSEAEYKYKMGVIDTCLPDGTVLPKQWALQDPSDYENGLYEVIKTLINKSNVKSSDIKAIGLATTASTVLSIGKDRRPLCEDKVFSSHMHAWPKMWKHHSAVKEAEDINRIAALENLEVLQNYGGSLNSEFFIPKVLECYRNDRSVFDAASTFMEMGDYLVSLLTGKTVRGIPYLTCKAMCTQSVNNSSINNSSVNNSSVNNTSVNNTSLNNPSVNNPSVNYPMPDFFEKLEEGFGKAFYEKFSFENSIMVYPDQKAGTLDPIIAQKLGLDNSTVVCGPQMDGYAGLPGCGVSQSGCLMMVLGTSTGFMILDEHSRPVKGMCGSVKDSMIRGYLCHAAGQASSGDNLAWFMDNIYPAKYEKEATKQGLSNFDYITGLASLRKASQSRLLALDWLNGNKSVLADTSLSGAIVGLGLDTKPEEIFRALVEASAFGARIIIETLEQGGVKINSIVSSGGIAMKNAFVVQLYADVLGTKIEVCSETQAAAMGSAMYASSACGLYENIKDAVNSMKKPVLKTYYPNEAEHSSYEELYRQYVSLHNYFGLGENNLMKELRKRK